ncbi:hypothetical protein Tco_1056686 [Tanacetum coccineum]|uniref:Uncharacterized protein n=1 Tax=Tanacetum coccineum TaxID=301880 RepID=A0ABQ5H3F2_9ASTR
MDASDGYAQPLPATQSQKDFVSKLTEIHSFLLTLSLRSEFIHNEDCRILLESISNRDKLMVAGNPVKKILLKLNSYLDHRSLLTDIEGYVKLVVEGFKFQLAAQCQSVKVSKKFKKMQTSKLIKNGKSSRPDIASPQDGKKITDGKEIVLG